MRVSLKVPYEQKDSAKAFGAKWDALKKEWFLTDPEDLTPFMRWIARPAEAPTKRQKDARDFGLTTSRPPADYVPCSCAEPPWEDCIHTAQDDHESIAFLRGLK